MTMTSLAGARSLMSSRCLSQHQLSSRSIICVLFRAQCTYCTVYSTSMCRVSCDADLPAPPETLSGRSLSANSVELSWSMPAEARAAPSALEYMLRYRPKGEPNSSEVRITLPSSSPTKY